MRVLAIAAVLSAALVGAAQGPVPYIVTTAPLDIGARSIRLCIAVRNNDVWWWQGGRNGCVTRTSSVVAADRVMATTTETDKRLTFALPLIPLPGSTNRDGIPITVLLHADGDTLSSVGPNGVIAQVATVERPNLDIPQQP
jgi:hypothetical protein